MLLLFKFSFNFFSDNCDLNLRVDDSGFKCCPVTVEGFGFMWAGARTNYGVNKGKVGYEMKVCIIVPILAEC